MNGKNKGLFQGRGSGNKKNDLKKIVFRDDQDRLRRELLVEEAENWAHRVAKRVSYTQLRKFYSEALALKSKMEEKVKKTGEEEGFKEMEALVGMLISKANYSKIKSRFFRKDGTYENEELFNFINSCVRSIHSQQDFNDFVLLFEAVLGFYPRKN